VVVVVVVVVVVTDHFPCFFTSAKEKPGVKNYKGGRIIKSEVRSEQDIRAFKKMKQRKAEQMRGIRPHKKLKPNQSRPSKKKFAFKNFYSNGRGK